MTNDLFVPLPSLFKLASHEVRWNLLHLLAWSDYRVQDLVAMLKLPQNLVSYHLKLLRQGQLVTEHRSIADERFVFYSLDLAQFQLLYQSAAEALHPAIVLRTEDTDLQEMQEKFDTLRVLFLCTENSARSQMAEALLRHLSHGTIDVCSAGSHISTHIHPHAIRVMESIGIDMSQHYPKHFNIYEGQHFDVIVTVCDRMLETCPTFPGDPARIHWSFPDPALVQGTRQEQLRAFEQTSLQLTTRIRFLLTRLEREKKL